MDSKKVWVELPEEFVFVGYGDRIFINTLYYKEGEEPSIASLYNGEEEG